MASVHRISTQDVIAALEATASLKRFLTLLKSKDQGHFAELIVLDLYREFGSVIGNRTPGSVNEALVAHEPPERSGQSQSDFDTDLSSTILEPRPIGLDARAIPSRRVKDRGLRKRLVEDLILVFLAINRDGVVPSDVGKELERLDLKEPPGTTASRVARMRERGAILPYSNSNPGIWVVSAQGIAEANKAIRKHNFRIPLQTEMRDPMGESR